MASSIAQAVGLRFGPAEQPEAQLLEYLRDKEILLVLDNFEHLLGGSASSLRSQGPGVGGRPPAPADGTHLLVSILKSAPKVTMLVTSRERLGLQAEHLFDVSGLPVPSMDDGRWAMDDRSKSTSSIVHRPSSIVHRPLIHLRPWPR
jgi:hypothetical protein